MVPPSFYINPILAEISPVLSMIDIYDIEYYLYSGREEKRLDHGKGIGEDWFE